MISQIQCRGCKSSLLLYGAPYSLDDNGNIFCVNCKNNVQFIKTSEIDHNRIPPEQIAQSYINDDIKYNSKTSEWYYKDCSSKFKLNETNHKKVVTAAAKLVKEIEIELRSKIVFLVNKIHEVSNDK